ncbi:MAG: F0F1 ATP synthase subunit alpha [Armatimonadota bacterium]
MAVRPEEVTSLLKQQLEKYRTKLEMVGVGVVLQVGDGIARVYGLENCRADELLKFPGEVMGMAFNLEEDNVGVMLLGSDEEVAEGDMVETTGRIVEVPVGPQLRGRVVDALGRPVDGKGPITADKHRPIEGRAPGVVERKPVEEPLQTGLKAIDSMTPIGRGQRELIIGDRQTGKTALAIDAIINQRDKGVDCIYVAIGQKLSSVAQVVSVLERYGAMEHTTVVAAAASDPAAMKYIAPYAGCAMGEEIRDNGGHALIVYDDLSKHAQAYREVSLLIRRPPGREAYPGDIFNLHSRLLERAAKLSDELGGGSLTALPIVETQAGDYAAYIPTNVISITDGQIYLESELFYAGVRPAINVGISVSRVGGDAQNPAMRSVAGSLRLDLANYREYAAFAQFSSDLDAATQAILSRGERMVEVLKQDQYEPMDVVDQILIVLTAGCGALDETSVSDIKALEPQLLKHLHERYPELVRELREQARMTDELREKLEGAMRQFVGDWQAPSEEAEEERAEAEGEAPEGEPAAESAGE